MRCTLSFRRSASTIRLLASAIRLSHSLNLHEGVKVSPGIGCVGTGAFDCEHGTLSRAREANKHGQWLAVSSHRDNDIGAQVS
jgi:hypothetical protein